MSPNDIRPRCIIAETRDAVNVQLVHSIADCGKVDADWGKYLLQHMLGFMHLVQHLMGDVLWHVQPLREPGNTRDQQDPGEAGIVEQAHSADG